MLFMNSVLQHAPYQKEYTNVGAHLYNVLAWAASFTLFRIRNLSPTGASRVGKLQRIECHNLHVQLSGTAGLFTIVRSLYILS